MPVVTDNEVSFTAKEQLEDLYNIASASGSNNPEAVSGEWFDWIRSKYGRYINIELEGISDKDYKKFSDYCTEQEDE